jgi:hypothetical protein
MVTGTLALAGALSLTGCQDLLGLTAGKPSGTGGAAGRSSGGGGAGGSTSTAGAGGSTSTAGSGGSTTGTGTCGPDCQSTVCQTAMCVDGQCVRDNKPEGTIVSDAKPGDCQSDRCDGKGTLVPGAANDDDADDADDCTWDACAGGLAGHLARRDGTPCKGGVCQAGACVSATCGAPDGSQDGTETDVDCGGACPPCAKGKKCVVQDDCKNGFCASGVCSPKLAVAVTNKAGQLTYGTFVPGASPAWTVVTDMTVYQSLALAAVSFDVAGEAVAAVRHGGSGARSARWASGAWGPVALWAISGDAGSGGSFVPTFASTDLALYLFVQNNNLEHEIAPAGGNSGGPFVAAGGASSPASAGAVTRQGHASLFYASGTDALVETRFLGGVWSKPSHVLKGDHADAPPVAITSEMGTLVVAVKRSGADHVLDWLLLKDGAAPVTGSIDGPKFASPNPAPRRLALAPRDDGGAILAYRDTAGNLAVWLADPDAKGLQWTAAQGLGGIAIAADPAVARGVGGARAELAWISSGANPVMRHTRLQSDGTWSVITDVVTGVTGAGGTVALATP